MRVRAVMSLSGGFTNPKVTKSFEWEGTTGGLWSHLLLRAGHCQLPTADQAAGKRDSSRLHRAAAPPSSSRFQQCPFCFISKLRKQRGGSGCPFVMQPLWPNILRGLLGEVSHSAVWLGCFSSSTVPLPAFGTSCCAEHGAASGWPLPNLAAWHGALPHWSAFACAPWADGAQ